MTPSNASTTTIKFDNREKDVVSPEDNLMEEGKELNSVQGPIEQQQEEEQKNDDDDDDDADAEEEAEDEDDTYGVDFDSANSQRRLAAPSPLQLPSTKERRKLKQTRAAMAATSSMSTKYDLIAAVCHHGRSTGSGHYTTFSMTEDGSWAHYNDSFCNLVPETKVASIEPYMLFYQRRGTQGNLSRKRKMRLFS
mmetsp:Transcript_2659/g.3673  ORF Transcript_2659/g.3673 Transcript_2659/m.3673 type:complete len:194 (+) Transcript_2659:3-584(+)